MTSSYNIAIPRHVVHSHRHMLIPTFAVQPMSIQIATKNVCCIRKGNPGSTLDESHIHPLNTVEIQEVAQPVAHDILTYPHSIHFNAWIVFSWASCVCAYCVKSHTNISSLSTWMIEQQIRLVRNGVCRLYCPRMLLAGRCRVIRAQMPLISVLL